LVKNSVNIDRGEYERLPNTMAYELSTLYKQKKNEKWAGFSTGRIYEQNLKKIAETGESVPWREKRGVPLAVYDSTKTEETRKNMEYYLNNKGFFEAKVSYYTKDKGKNLIKVYYDVKPGPKYEVENISYQSNDPTINLLINAISSQSVLKSGKTISQKNFADENARILKFLQNNGYATIGQNHIRTTGDSTNHKVNVVVEILPPAGDTIHTRYNIGTVNVYPNYQTGDLVPILLDTVLNGIHYNYTSKTPNIKPETINRNIFLVPGARFNKDLVLKTERLLTNLNSFRIITVQPQPREEDPSILDYNILLTPRKKLAFGGDIQVTASNNSLNSNNFFLLGSSGNLNLKNYNYLNGAIQLDFGLKGGVDLNLGKLRDPSVDLIFGMDFQANLGISWPRFVKWIGPYRLFNAIRFGKKDEDGQSRLFGDKFIDKLSETAKTNLNIRASYQDIFNFYTLPSAEIDYGYTVPINKNSAFQITHTGLNVYFPETKPQFDTILMDRPFLALSFSDQFFTGFFFKEFVYTYSAGSIAQRNKWDVRFNAELSGLEMFLANKLIAPKDTFKLFGEFEFSQFIKSEIAISHNRAVNEKTSLAFRYQMGIAHQFGFSDEVPYLRQFFAGGPNSMRGWRIRELGPGGYIDTQGVQDNVFFQTGNLQLEANAEIRMPLFNILKWAIFVDAGNVWTTDEDPDRPNSKFRFSSNSNDPTITPFYKQIAIASGIGLRFDLSYFVIRFDLGVKIRNPYPVQGSYWLPELKYTSVWKSTNVGLDISYPF